MHSIALICTFYWVTNSVDSETRFDFVGVCCGGGCSYLSVCLSPTTSARVPYLCLPPISSAKGVGVGLALVIQSSNSRFLGQYIWRHPLHIQKLKINTDNTHYIIHCLAIPTTILYTAIWIILKPFKTILRVSQKVSLSLPRVCISPLNNLR